MFGLKKNFKENSVEAYVASSGCDCDCYCQTCHCNERSRDKQNYTYNSTMSSRTQPSYVNSAYPR